MSRFCRVVFVALGVLCTAECLPLIAQEPEARTDEATQKTSVRKFDPSRRVPDYFGQIGLTPEQRESIYKIRGGHIAKINQLEEQIDQIRQQMQRECEGILTDTQRQLLDQRRKAASVSRTNPEVTRRVEVETAKASK